MLDGFGIRGQEKLKKGSVLIVGVGGLGSSLAFYLAAAGVGKIGLVDYDEVDISNLQRQILYTVKDIGRAKTDSAYEKISALNPNIGIKCYREKLTSENILSIISEYDVVSDGSDNFPTRYLINDACVLLNKPHVYASVSRFEAQVTVFRRNYAPCYRCLFPQPPAPDQIQNCSEEGILGVVPGFAGILQATEVIKILTGIGRVLYGRMLLYDAGEMSISEIEINKDENCPVCGSDPEITELIDFEAFCGVKPTENNTETERKKVTAADEITPLELKAALQKNEKIVLLDIRNSSQKKMGYFEKSVHIPFDELLLRKNELAAGSKIVVLCRIGKKSITAQNLLKSAGYDNVFSLAGGIEAWLKDVGTAFLKFT